jgi:hypothetical protein
MSATKDFKKEVLKIVDDENNKILGRVRQVLKVDKAFKLLDELCVEAEKQGLKVDEHYAVIIECLRRLDLVATISLAQDTCYDLPDNKLLQHISQAVFDDTKLLYAVECNGKWLKD